MCKPVTEMIHIIIRLLMPKHEEYKRKIKQVDENVKVIKSFTCTKDIVNN